MESWVRLPVDSAVDEWAGWLWCCSRSHACCPCACVCMCEVMGSEIGRNTEISGRSGAVRWDGCKTSPMALKSHTYIHTQRWRGLSPEAPMLHLWCTHTCLDVNAHAHLLTIKQMCAYEPEVSSQTAYILLGCAPISRINEEVSHFTVKQRVGLWGANDWSLQFLKSVFNNVIDF